MTTATETFHISLDAPDAYESPFVPRLFAPWASLLVDAACVDVAHRVLDVATGTGIARGRPLIASEGQGPSWGST